jgi:hypothetical protein
VHHHHFHRIVGRVKPRPRPTIHPTKVAANPDGCAQPVPGAKLPARPPGIAAGGLGVGKVASLAGIGGAAAVGGTVIGAGIPPGGHTITTPTTPVNFIAPPNPGGVPVPPPIITPPGGPSASPPTPPGGVAVPEPTTIAVFAMALAALALARFMRSPRRSRVRVEEGLLF